MAAVALAVVGVVILVFELRGTGRQEIGGDRRYSVFEVDGVPGNDSASAVTGDRTARYLEQSDDWEKRAGGPSLFTSGNGDDRRPSADASGHVVPRSSILRGVFQWNDGGFGPEQQRYASLPAPGSTSKRDEGGRQSDSANRRDAMTSTVTKSETDFSFYSSDWFNHYGSKERRLQRLDRKTYMRKVDLRLLQN
ncbi:hypothetical protein V5799_003556 [Amblyomma americanum]|uniref:Secreted protein n=1 Tax=Amblyomma americanum TaxID=6943 RepID=A0AAQ4D8M2_AMBAM